MMSTFVKYILVANVHTYCFQKHSLLYFYFGKLGKFFQRICIQFSVVQDLGFLNSCHRLGKRRCCLGLRIKKVYKNEAQPSFFVTINFFCLLVLLLCSFLISYLFGCCFCFVLSLLDPSFLNLVLISHCSSHTIPLVLLLMLLLLRCFSWAAFSCIVTFHMLLLLSHYCFSHCCSQCYSFHTITFTLLLLCYSWHCS